MAAATTMRRVVPWFAKEDWGSVYQELFHDDPALQRHALDKIAVWKCRISYRLSAGIDCTWHLVSVELQCQDAERHGNLLKLDQALRLAFSMALVRFVNHLTEKKQTRSYAQPIHVLADELGLPDWLVDMRHEATHTNLPALPVLRTAARSALAWVKRQYWDAMASEDVSGDELPRTLQFYSTEQCLEKLGDLLVTFTQDHYKFLQDNPRGNLPRNSDLQRTLTDIAALVHKCREKAVSLVTDDGYLLPTQEQLQALGVVLEEFVATEALSLPDILVSLWQPLLKLFRQENLLPLLIQKLVCCGDSEDCNLKPRLCAGWISVLLKNYTSGQKIGLHQSDLQSLLKLCLLHPTSYTHRLIHSFLDAGAVLSSQQQAQLSHLLNCYHGNPVDEPSAEDEMEAEEELAGGALEAEKIFTVDQLLEIRGVADDRPLQTSATSHWNLADDVVGWPSYALGTCPNIRLSYTSLELDSVVDRLTVTTEASHLPDHTSCTDYTQWEDESTVQDPGDSPQKWTAGVLHLDLF